MQQREKASGSAALPLAVDKTELELKRVSSAHRMNDNTHHGGWVVCSLVYGGRRGVCSFLRWSSTGGLGVCILALARMGIACVSLRRPSTDRSLPYSAVSVAAAAQCSGSRAVNHRGCTGCSADMTGEGGVGIIGVDAALLWACLHTSLY